MNVSILIGTFGDERWRDLAWSHAFPSVSKQGDLGTPGAPLEVLIKHESDRSLAWTRNALGGAAKGDWLCFLDADDQLAPGYISAMENAEPSVMTEPALLVPSLQFTHGGGFLDVPTIPAWRKPLIEVNCACIGTLVQRELFLALGGFGEEPIYEDWALWLRAVRAGAKMIRVPDAVYRAGVGETSGRNTFNGGALDTYWEIRGRLEPGFRWNRVKDYKIEA